MRAGTGAGRALHDAARPLASPALAEAVTEAVAAGHAVAVPVLPLSDTVKHVDSADVVAGSPDRTGLRVLQTPQAFRAGVLDADVLAKVLASTEPLEQAWSVARRARRHRARAPAGVRRALAVGAPARRGAGSEQA